MGSSNFRSRSPAGPFSKMIRRNPAFDKAGRLPYIVEALPPYEVRIMPTYEYECTKCGHAFERFQNMSDKPLSRCPECRCKVKRLLGTGAGLIFKGSGFYETDYRSDSYRSREKADKEKGKKSSPSGKKDKTAAKATDKKNKAKSGKTKTSKD
jgi:putative FmdB family regulatory protein